MDVGQMAPGLLPSGRGGKTAPPVRLCDVGPPVLSC